MNTFFENVYDVLFAPRTAFERIASERPISQAVLVFFLSVLLPVIPMCFTISAKTHFAAAFVIGIQLIASLVMWILGAAVWGLLAEFFGGTGQSSSLFAALGFAHLPRLLLVPGMMVVSIMPPAIKTILEVVLIAGVFLWSLVLDAAAIRESYSLSGAKAALVLFTPMLFVVILMIFMVIAAGTMLMQLPFPFENVLIE